MSYSISNEKEISRLSLHNPLNLPIIEWQITQSLKDTFLEYQNNYSVIHDVKLMEYSYFDCLCNLFIKKLFSFNNFLTLDFNEELKHYLYHKRYAHYSELNDEDSYDKAIDDSKLFVNYLDEIQQKNSLILSEFKAFLFNFFNHVKTKFPKEFSCFKEVYNFLLDDLLFFKKSPLKSLAKYNYIIGFTSTRFSGSRGKTDDFIPAGLCTYGSKIFINSNKDDEKHGKLWFNRNLRHTFYHEMGHALDYLYENEIVVKKQKLPHRSSFNPEFLKICIKEHKKLQTYKSKLRKDTMNWMNYYSKPQFYINEEIVIDNSLTEINEKIQSDISAIFSEQITVPPTKVVPFSPKIKKNTSVWDYSKPLEETWAESFSYIFDWLRNGFNEYDRFTIKSGRSSDRLYIKVHYDSLLYILNNFDWSKLNIPNRTYLKRKNQIKMFLQYVKKIPLCLNNTRFRNLEK